MGRYGFVALFLATAGFTVLGVVTDRSPGDLSLTLRLQEMELGWFQDVMDWAFQTDYGLKITGVGLVVSGVLFIRRYWLESTAMILALIGGSLITSFKELISRPRPTDEFVQIREVIDGSSFPSGHTFLAVLILGMIWYLAPALLGTRPWGVRGLRFLIALVVVAIGIYRVYLGVHWPSDVIGGYLFGGSMLGLAILFSRGATARILAPRVSEAGQRRHKRHSRWQLQ